jgi:hypothetical protein
MEQTVEYLKNNMPDLTRAVVSETELKSEMELKEERWLQKRVGKITASILNDIMSKGRGVPYGQKAINAMRAVKYERRTGYSRQSASSFQMEWGKENETHALDWYKWWRRDENTGIEDVKDCRNDFDDIVFNQPFDGFGDSPDFLVYRYGKIIGVGEIKCPVDVVKIEELFTETTAIDQNSEYYNQLIGHFIGCPEANFADLVIFDAYTNTGKVFTLTRHENEAQIAAVKARIMQVSAFIDYCMSNLKNLETING